MVCKQLVCFKAKIRRFSSSWLSAAASHEFFLLSYHGMISSPAFARSHGTKIRFYHEFSNVGSPLFSNFSLFHFSPLGYSALLREKTTLLTQQNTSFYPFFVIFAHYPEKIRFNCAQHSAVEHRIQDFGIGSHM